MEQKSQFNVWVLEKEGNYFSERHKHNKKITSADQHNVRVVNALNIPEEDINIEEQLDLIILNSMEKDIDTVRNEISNLWQEVEKVG